MIKPTKRDVCICGLAAMIILTILSCKCCDSRHVIDEQEIQLQEKKDSIGILQDSLKNVSERLQKKNDSIVVLQDSLKNVSERLADCKKSKCCPVKKTSAKTTVKTPAKKTVSAKKPASVVAKKTPVAVAIKPVVVKPTSEPVEIKPVVAKPTAAPVIVNNNSGNNNSGDNVVNINNGTINNYYGSDVDTAKCSIIVRAKIIQTIKTR